TPGGAAALLTCGSSGAASVKSPATPPAPVRAGARPNRIRAAPYDRDRSPAPHRARVAAAQPCSLVLLPGARRRALDGLPGDVPGGGRPLAWLLSLPARVLGDRC